ncbi:IS66 family transposase [Acidihalobacter aeolianus]|uniref:IS66 family transposase n=1 Tax=Acidihalobacter aeolianus TaxID=2792603 RepID=A0A1D8K9Q0_9GAMM|nr:IS66 family transposase [Acidihalobacter aeolianus]AOV15729.1 IS66 family transposase [Acidihalobacter aeolianus]AOV16049.1 IS66 family transposase [Acidihalobacter aeolianus]AOV16195.1 IS66 family transposase [Acidihalobacter aeolianus]AOV17152.1 IS66 family transposase [Acidihalobacter aeolianus]AOV17405.1 IS66 family transposase [Acidihalobacter aeolianus]
MRIDGVDIEITLAQVRAQLEQEKDLSPALRASIEMMLMLFVVLLNRLGLNSRNSSQPPASDPNRPRSQRVRSSRPSGGQPGHVGKTLRPVEHPDEIEVLKIDRRRLPKGCYTEAGFETRQVFDIDISRIVTEYRAQILENESGQRFVASFPEGVDKKVQYGSGLKAHAVYLSQYQLLPYKRIQDYFADQLGIPLSDGSLVNFNREAFTRLAAFEAISKTALAKAVSAHADETGVNIDGKRHWLHALSNADWTHYQVHSKRGQEAMDAIGILPRFRGVLCHDHWKPYYRYRDCTHALCNAHHLRELERAFEQDGQQWAEAMGKLLREIHQAVENAGGILPLTEANAYRQRYRDVLEAGQLECPEPEKPPDNKPRGRIKRSKARNLLERLMAYEDDVLRFMVDVNVPFTNNQAENDIRMTKVQQKISGCFRSLEGAAMFCRIRGYLSTCRKQGVTASEALRLVFDRKLPAFALAISEN